MPSQLPSLQGAVVPLLKNASTDGMLVEDMLKLSRPGLGSEKVLVDLHGDIEALLKVIRDSAAKSPDKIVQAVSPTIQKFLQANAPLGGKVFNPMGMQLVGLKHFNKDERTERDVELELEATVTNEFKKLHNAVGTIISRVCVHLEKVKGSLDAYAARELQLSSLSLVSATSTSPVGEPQSKSPGEKLKQETVPSAADRSKSVSPSNRTASPLTATTSTLRSLSNGPSTYQRMWKPDVSPPVERPVFATTSSTASLTSTYSDAIPASKRVAAEEPPSSTTSSHRSSISLPASSFKSNPLGESTTTIDSPGCNSSAGKSEMGTYQRLYNSSRRPPINAATVEDTRSNTLVPSPGSSFRKGTITKQPNRDLEGGATVTPPELVKPKSMVEQYVLLRDKVLPTVLKLTRSNCLAGVATEDVAELFCTTDPQVTSMLFGICGSDAERASLLRACAAVGLETAPYSLLSTLSVDLHRGDSSSADKRHVVAIAAATSQSTFYAMLPHLPADFVDQLQPSEMDVVWNAASQRSGPESQSLKTKLLAAASSKKLQGSGWCVASVTGHTSPVTAVCDAGTVIASSDKEGMIRYWTSEGAQTAGFRGHDKEIRALCHLPSGLIASGSRDKTIKLWDSTGKLMRTLTGHSGEITALLVFGDKLVSSSKDDTLRMWSEDDGVCTAVLTGHDDKVLCMAIVFRNKSDYVLASGSEDSSIKLWNVNGTCVMTCDGHANNVTCLAEAGDTRMVSGSADCTARVWDKLGNCVHILKGHTDVVESVTHFQGMIASCSADHTVRLWALNDGTCLHTLIGHSDKVFCLERFTDTVLASGSKDGTVRLWSSSGQCHKVLTGHTESVKVLCRAKGILISASMDKTLRFWQ